jgi:tRNA 2-selenouridine synthase
MAALTAQTARAIAGFMAFALDVLPSPGALPFDEVIDVRSPAEFAEDHVPGAINLPVLSDVERARVGTVYVRQDRFLARKIGAAMVARNAAAHLEGPLAERPGGWRPLIYCWRGGQRSGSFAAILGQIGWRVDTVAGGYKSYRALVKRMLYDDPLPARVVLIDGGTGTAKTRLLHHLREIGTQTVDLEGLAAHRGSNFGALSRPQPSQKMFESHLARAVAALDPAKPLFLEAESNSIGRIKLPPSLWSAMRDAEVIRIEAPLRARAAHLVEAYADLGEDRSLLHRRIDTLRPYHAKDRIAAWHAMARAGEALGLAEALIAEHYDPRYRRAASRGDARIERVQGLGDRDLAALAYRIAGTGAGSG